MALIHPFRALRPTPENAAAVSSVPYDVVSTDEARELADGNPLSFLHVTPSEIDLPHERGSLFGGGLREGPRQLRCAAQERAARRRGRAVALLLPAADGQARADRRGRLLFGRRIRAGRHQEARAHPARQGRRPHPAHDRAAGADRRRVPDLQGLQRARCDRPAGHRDARRSSTSLRPTTCTTRSGRPTPGRPASSSTLFAQVPALYIADGHHRAASAARTRAELRTRGDGEEAGTFIAVAFPDNQMQILPYNRTVRDLAGRTPQQFLAALRQQFHVTDGPARPRRQGRGRDVPRRPVVHDRSVGRRAGGRVARQQPRRRAAAAPRARARC